MIATTQPLGRIATKRDALLVACGFLLLLAPAVTQCFLINNPEYRFGLLWSIASVLFFYALFGTRLFFVVTAFFAWLVPFEIYYQTKFKAISDQVTVSFVMESNFSESLDYFGLHNIVILVSVAAACSFFFASLSHGDTLVFRLELGCAY
jgi:glucan phosphoethanolaminetransferase (alkaline phosphatase superfamily)